MRWPVLLVLAPLLAACPSGSPEATLPDGAVGQPPPRTNPCSGDEASCIHGVVKWKGFSRRYDFARVFLFSVYPSGDVTAVGAGNGNDGGNEVASDDDTFAFSQVAPGRHYFLRVLASYDTNDPTATVETIVGPLEVPLASPLIVDVRPVSLEVLQTVPEGPVGPTLTYAAARVYDPDKGHELTDAAVTVAANGKTTALTYGTMPNGIKGYLAAFPAETETAPQYTFTTTHPLLGTMTWNVFAGDVPFNPVLLSPAEKATVPANTPLTVTWGQADSPLVTHRFLQLFVQTNGAYTSVYTSPGSDPTEPTTETIPASAISLPGSYLLNAVDGMAVCDAKADGCGVSTTTGSIHITAQ